MTKKGKNINCACLYNSVRVEIEKNVVSSAKKIQKAKTTELKILPKYGQRLKASVDVFLPFNQLKQLPKLACPFLGVFANLRTRHHNSDHSFFCGKITS